MVDDILVPEYPRRILYSSADDAATITRLQRELEAVRKERDAALWVLAGLNAALDRYWNDPLRSQADHAEQHAHEITFHQGKCRALIPSAAQETE